MAWIWWRDGETGQVKIDGDNATSITRPSPTIIPNNVQEGRWQVEGGTDESQQRPGALHHEGDARHQSKPSTADEKRRCGKYKTPGEPIRICQADERRSRGRGAK